MERQRLVNLFGVVHSEIPQIEVDQDVVHDGLGQRVDRSVVLLQELFDLK